MNFIWESVTILLVGFALLRLIGKKSVAEMTGLEIVTMLAIASMISHAVSDKGLWQTIIILCIFASTLMFFQFLSNKSDRVEQWVLGKATLVIKDGELLPGNLRKLRMSVDQLEAKLREKGITSIRDVKHATIEMSGQLGYELMNHAKPVTLGELEQLLAALQPAQPPKVKNQGQNGNMFNEIVNGVHDRQIPQKLD